MKSFPQVAPKLSLVGAFFFIAMVAFAESHEHAHVPHLSDLVWPFINFGIFVLILILCLRKPLPAGWRGRADRLKTEVESASGEEELAARKLIEVRGRIANLDREALEIAASIKEDAKREAESIVAQAESRSVYIMDHAKASAAAELGQLEKRVQQELAEEVLSRAKSKLQATFSEDADRGFRRAALEGLRSLKLGVG